MKTPRACRNLEDVRAAVNAIDRDIVKLLGKRAKYAMARGATGTPRPRVTSPASCAGRR